MRINNSQSVSGTSNVRNRGRSGGNGSVFSLPEGEESTSVAESGAFAPIGGMDAILALQEVDPDENRRQTLNRGNEILDSLDQLKLDLMNGRIEPDRLDRIASLLLRQSEKTTDPGLRSVMEEVELRARVELAKLGKFD